MGSLDNRIILGFDFGMKHIGVATGQFVTHSASPLTTISAEDGIPKWDEIKDLIDMWKPDFIVLGLPLTLAGEKQSLSFCAKRFGNRLHEKFRLQIKYVDEKLSTWEAKQQLGSTFAKASKKEIKKINALAAAIILEQWFNENHLKE